jgi:hypothetical protein
MEASLTGILQMKPDLVADGSDFPGFPEGMPVLVASCLQSKPEGVVLGHAHRTACDVWCKLWDCNADRKT